MTLNHIAGLMEQSWKGKVELFDSVIPMKLDQSQGLFWPVGEGEGVKERERRNDLIDEKETRQGQR